MSPIESEPWPDYAFVPGGPWPHPARAEQANPSRASTDALPPISNGDWAGSAFYQRGFALFNAGYYWEAHEMWEGLWHASGRRGTTADFLKGLIKLAAAGVKAREGRPGGVARHSARAAALFEKTRDATGREKYLGLGVEWLTATANELVAKPPGQPIEIAPVEVVFDFQLLPRL